MSGIQYDKVEFRQNMATRVIRGYIQDEVAKTVINMDIEQVVNTAYEQFFEKVEKIVRSEKLDNAEKVEKLLRLVKKYEFELD